MAERAPEKREVTGSTPVPATHERHPLALRASSPAEASDAKLRGGFYTPPELATAAARWAVRTSTARVLEPSAGDGAFVRPIGELLQGRKRCQAIELSPSEAHRIEALGLASVNVEVGDAFTWFNRNDVDAHFDAVVGNPPFIRYQNFPEAHRQQGFRLMAEAGLKPNRLTNAWVPFVVLATRALKPGGRLAMVLPAELMQVSYSAELRGYLARNFSELRVVTFRELVFSGIQQETVLLLGVRGNGPATISLAALDNLEQLSDDTLHASDAPQADLDHAREKWTQYYLDAAELQLIRELETSPHVRTLGDLAEVDVGIVTGRNEFFVMAPSDARASRLRRNCIPMVGRSAQIPGLLLTKADWKALSERDQRCLLLQLGPRERDELSAAARAYVENGESLGYHEGYKCRIRAPRWWHVPSVWTPDAFLLRQIHDGPRIVANQAGATCTDTIHRVRTSPGTSATALAAASMNSLTWAFAEIRGRSYGGGVLELEPTEAESLPLPLNDEVVDSIEELDLWVRRKETDQVLDEIDRRVLEPLGVSKRDIARLRGVWRRLAARRRDRKVRSRNVT